VDESIVDDLDVLNDADDDSLSPLHYTVSLSDESTPQVSINFILALLASCIDYCNALLAGALKMTTNELRQVSV